MLSIEFLELKSQLNFNVYNWATVPFEFCDSSGKEHLARLEVTVGDVAFHISIYVDDKLCEPIKSFNTTTGNKVFLVGDLLRDCGWEPAYITS